MKWLTDELFAIPVQSASIQFIESPSLFYATLLENIQNAKQRIILSSLYLGTDPLEKTLIEKIKEVKKKNKNLNVNILLDYLRGTRQNTNSESSSTLLQSICDECQIRFFFHPNMSNTLKNLLPQRVNEIIGLQHMKFFIFDNSIIISGANLSEIYFTNRQDRYILIKNCSLLADFFSDIFNLFATHSLLLQKSGEIYDGEDILLHPFSGNKDLIKKSVTLKIEKLFLNFKNKVENYKLKHNIKSDTYVYPFLQMGSFKINQEVDLLTRLFKNSMLNDLDITISTGYFNLFDNYSELILKQDRKLPVKIVLSAPQANGFYNAMGLSKNIPAIYVNNAKIFLDKINQCKNTMCAVLYEYFRPNWTFHAKGVWIKNLSKNDKKEAITATIIGSSNFGYRSVYRDLEAQILLVTENEELSQKIIEERQSILKYCRVLDFSMFDSKDYIIPHWVRHFSKIFRQFF